MPSNVLTLDTSEVADNLTNIVMQYPSVAYQLLQKVALAIVAEAKNQCPVGDTGLLKASINCMNDEEGKLSIVIYADRAYAAAQHEHVEYRHDVGKAKFIEDPLLTIGLGDMPKTIAENLLYNITESLAAL